jgi:lipopolysaccharide biosynthesis glycosyltransferase
VVALVNSLRLTGHDEQIVVLSCGLDDRQQRLLAREADVVPGPTLNSIAHAFLLRAFGPRQRPAKAMILLDADLIVTSSLDLLFTLAGIGQIVAFADALRDRHSERWESELGLTDVRRQPYVNTGVMALPAAGGGLLLYRLEELQPRVDLRQSYWAEGVPDDPFYFLDQDILNALLASEFEPEDVTVLPHRLAPHPPFDGLKVDPASLHCQYASGEEPFVLHHVLAKPWLDRTSPNIYSALLPRLLLADDLPIRLEARDLPRRLRLPLLARAADRGTAVAHTVATSGRMLGALLGRQ